MKSLAHGVPECGHETAASVPAPRALLGIVSQRPLHAAERPYIATPCNLGSGTVVAGVGLARNNEHLADTHMSHAGLG